MDLRSEYPKDSIESSLVRYKRCHHQISKYLKAKHVGAISKHLGIKKEQTKDVIINSLDKLGWNNDNLEERHIFWLSLLRICIEVKNPTKRWGKAKSSICEALISWYEDDLISFPEIFNDIRIPLAAIPKIGIAYKIGSLSFFEGCLNTVIFFNAKDIDVSPAVFIGEWRWWSPNFCEWDFRRDGTLFKIRLKNQELQEKFVPKLAVDDMWNFERSYNPTSLLFKDELGRINEIKVEDLRSYLSKKAAQNAIPQNVEAMILLLIQHASSKEIERWLETTSGRVVKSEEAVMEFQSMFNRAVSLGVDKALAKKYFPEYVNDFTDYKAINYPFWKPEDGLLDLQILKLEFREFYLSKLPTEEKIKALEKLIPTLGFDVFNYENFRTVIKEWEITHEYQKIQFTLKSFEKIYSRAKQKKKKMGTRRTYASLCLIAIKTALDTKCSFYRACGIVSRNLKKEKIKLKLRARITPEVIKSRSYEIAKEKGISSLGSESDLQNLYDRLLSDENVYEEPDITIPLDKPLWKIIEERLK